MVTFLVTGLVHAVKVRLLFVFIVYVLRDINGQSFFFFFLSKATCSTFTYIIKLQKV